MEVVSPGKGKRGCRWWLLNLRNIRHMILWVCTHYSFERGHWVLFERGWWGANRVLAPPKPDFGPVGTPWIRLWLWWTPPPSPSTRTQSGRRPQLGCFPAQNRVLGAYSHSDCRRPNVVQFPGPLLIISTPRNPQWAQQTDRRFLP